MHLESAVVRLIDLKGHMQSRIADLDCATFDSRPWVTGPALARRRLAMVSTAGLAHRDDRPFPAGAADFRAIPSDTDPSDILMSHVSVNYDRTGYQQDINVAFPIDRLAEMTAAGAIGSIGPTHYSVMGATDPLAMADAAREMADQMKRDAVDTALLVPV